MRDLLLPPHKGGGVLVEGLARPPMTFLDFFPVSMEPSVIVTASLMSGMTAIVLVIGYFAAEPRSRATRALARTT